MEKLRMPLLTEKYTEVFHEGKEDRKYNAPHHFEVVSVPQTSTDTPILVGRVDFQEGPIKECGVNGICNEDLLNMVICRLEHFQKTEFSCRENALAITKLEEALLWLRKRTMGREQRGIEGTHKV